MRRHRQQGSIAITFGIFLLVGVVLVESLALGFQFYMRRQLQTVADLSALAGAQRLNGTDCTTALSVAKSNAALNGATTSLVASCGNWSPTSVQPLHYSAQSTLTVDPNAVEVQVTGTLPFLPAWMPSGTVYAQAVAIRNGSPVAVFSIGSALLVSNLGCVAGCGAIANVNLTMLNFLKALGITVPSGLTVGGLTTLLATNSSTFTLSNVLSAVGSLTGLGNLNGVVSLSASVLNMPVQLLTTVNGRGLFTFDSSAASTDTAASVLGANLNVLDLVTAAAGVANRNNAISATLGAGGITAQVSVVSPPSIGVGGVGASAYSGQIRVYAHITTAGITGAVPLLGLLASVDLPIEIDVADAQATITSLCTAKDSSNNDLATFAVSAPLVNACIGNMTASSVMSGTTSCSAGLTSQTILSLVGGLATVKAGFSLAALPNNSTATLAAGSSYTTTNPVAIGTTLTQLLTALNTEISASLLPSVSATGNSGNSLLSGIIGTTTAASNQSTGATTLANALLAGSGNVTNTALTAANTAVSGLTTLSSALNSTGTSALSGTTTSALLPSLLQGTTSLVTSLVTSVTQVLNGVLSALVGPCSLLTGTPQTCVASKLPSTTSGTTPSSTLLTVIGTVATLLQPALNSLGSTLATALNSLLGANVNVATLRLISLNCIGTAVRLVQ